MTGDHVHEHTDDQAPVVDVQGFLSVFDRLALALEELRGLDATRPGRRFELLSGTDHRFMVGPKPTRTTLSVPTDGTENSITLPYNSLSIVNGLPVAVYLWTEAGLPARAAASTIPAARVIQVASGALVTVPISGSRIYVATTGGQAGYTNPGEIGVYAWPTVQALWRG